MNIVGKCKECGDTLYYESDYFAIGETPTPVDTNVSIEDYDTDSKRCIDCADMENEIIMEEI